MKSDTGKCQFITNIDETHQIFVGNSSIGSSSCEKLLGVKTDSDLTFDDHVKDTCKTSNQKLRALVKATPYTKTEKKKFLVNFFSVHSLAIAP